MKGKKYHINQYVREKVINDVARKLLEKGGQEAVDRFMEGPFGYFLDLMIGNSANNALHELMAYELEDATSTSEFERWFRLGGSDVSFKAVDYALVTGLLFTKKNYDLNAVHHNIPEGGMFHRRFQMESTRVETLLNCFRANDLGDDVEDYEKAANIIFLYHLLICCGDVWIVDWVWALIDDRERWNRFQMGSLHVADPMPQHESCPKASEALENHTISLFWTDLGSTNLVI